MTTRRLLQITTALGIIAALLGACGSPAPQPAAPAQASTPGGSTNPGSSTGSAVLSTPEKINVEIGPDQPQIVLLEPQDGSRVSSPFFLSVGVTNFPIPISNAGIHVAIDANCAPPGSKTQEDGQHVSLPIGTLENPRFELPVGKHRLCIQASDQDNTALEGPGMMRTIDLEIVP